MMLNIIPYQNPWYSCMDVLIFTLARNWGIEHRLMFANAWRFHYEKVPPAAQTHSFEESLDVRELVQRREIETPLRKYHGLLIESNPVLDIDQAVVLVKRNLAKGMPVVLGVDAFHCHWSSAYHKYHLDHSALSVGLDEEKRSFFMVDPYLTTQIVEFPLSEYAETLRDSLSFERSAGVPDLPNWRALVRNAASAMTNKFQQMRDFAADLEKYLDFYQEVARHEDPFASRLVLFFKTLGFSRLNYAEFLAYLSEVSGEVSLNQAAARMKEHGNELFKIFLLLMKTSLTPDRFKVSRITQKLREVADGEEALAKDLLHATQDNDCAAAENAAVEAR